MVGELPDIADEIDAREVGGPVERFMDKRHGADPVLAVVEALDQDGILDIFGLQMEQARDDLQIVLDRW